MKKKLSLQFIEDGISSESETLSNLKIDKLSDEDLKSIEGGGCMGSWCRSKTCSSRQCLVYSG
ncbi:MAG: hypothetical protein GY714_21385 [Desulfobacterales bacterium]|nr:hypothetical protein [Desulfobacterales bacterium]MCP4163046.1 hypothetical protein [Deltaproteobacteria bacterium]